MFILVRYTQVNNHTLSHQIGIFHTHAGAKRMMTRLMKTDNYASFKIKREYYYNTCVMMDALTQMYYNWQDYRYKRLIKKSRHLQQKIKIVRKRRIQG